MHLPKPPGNRDFRYRFAAPDLSSPFVRRYENPAVFAEPRPGGMPPPRNWWPISKPGPEDPAEPISGTQTTNDSEPESAPPSSPAKQYPSTSMDPEGKSKIRSKETEKFDNQPKSKPGAMNTEETAEAVLKRLKKKEKKKKQKAKKQAKQQEEEMQKWEKLDKKQRDVKYDRWVAQVKSMQELEKLEKQLKLEEEKLEKAQKVKEKIVNATKLLKNKKTEENAKQDEMNNDALTPEQAKASFLEECEKAYLEWIEKAKNKPKPTPPKKGLENLSAIELPTLINPIPRVLNRNVESQANAEPKKSAKKQDVSTLNQAKPKQTKKAQKESLEKSKNKRELSKNQQQKQDRKAFNDWLKKKEDKPEDKTAKTIMKKPSQVKPVPVLHKEYKNWLKDTKTKPQPEPVKKEVKSPSPDKSKTVSPSPPTRAAGPAIEKNTENCVTRTFGVELSKSETDKKCCEWLKNNESVDQEYPVPWQQNNEKPKGPQ